jgi:hypothetical protein
MAADEATKPVPSPGDDHDREDRAAAGAARFFRKHVRTIVVVVVVAIAAYAALAGPGNGSGGGGDGDDAGSSATTTTVASTGAGTGSGDGVTTAPGGSAATTAPGATEVTDPAATSTLVPPDVDSDRPPIDLAKPPVATDPVELARWWAGTYTAYIGAEAPADLVGRLADWTTPELLDELRALPLAASYDPPLDVEGASAVELPSTPGATGATVPAGARQLRATVQTPVAVVVYDMTLVPGAGGTWLVREAERL